MNTLTYSDGINFALGQATVSLLFVIPVIVIVLILAWMGKLK